MPKIIRLESISQKPVIIGADGNKKEAISEEEYLHRLRVEKKKLEKEIKDLKKEMSTLMDNTKKEASSIIEDAKNQAETILKDNKEKCNKELEEANKKKEMIFSESKENGFQKGFEEGKNKAIKDIHSKMDSLIEEFQNTIDRVNSERDKIFLSLKDEIGKLIISYVKKIIKLELNTNKDIIFSNIESALHKISSKESITIILSKEDIANVEEHADDIKKKIRGLKNIRFMAEPYISKGGCIIETDFGSIDATIKSQIFELEKLVLGPNISPELIDT